jgi:hypothetical protein
MIATISLIVSLALLLICLAGGAYFLVVLPRRWREPLGQALDLIDSDDRDDLELADRLLGQAMDAGPRGKALAEARFAQSFVRALLGRYESARYAAALATLEQMTAAGEYDPDTAYLELWIQARLENHDRVCDHYDRHAELLRGRTHSRYIAAISHLNLAARHWRRREVDGALHYFDKVRALGELTEQIPPGVDDLQLIKGIQAIFDSRSDDAREAFLGARERAIQQGRTTVEADLGLLACDWRDGQPDRLNQGIAVLADNLGRNPPAGEEGRLLQAPVALLSLVVLLRTWAERPALGGLPDEDHQELRRRAQVVREADPDLGDADLIDGLIGYYFAFGEEERERALATLEHGSQVAKGIMLPEALDLVLRERALGGAGDAITRYRRLLSEFLADPTRPDRDRAEYRRIQARFASFADPDAAAVELEPTVVTPVEEHLRRGDAIRRRIELIVFPRIRDRDRDDPAAVELRALLSKLDEASRSHAATTESLYGAERNLITQVGDFLLPEDHYDQYRA